MVKRYFECVKTTLKSSISVVRAQRYQIFITSNCELRLFALVMEKFRALQPVSSTSQAEAKGFVVTSLNPSIETSTAAPVKFVISKMTKKPKQESSSVLAAKVKNISFDKSRVRFPNLNLLYKKCKNKFKKPTTSSGHRSFSNTQSSDHSSVEDSSQAGKLIKKQNVTESKVKNSTKSEGNTEIPLTVVMDESIPTDIVKLPISLLESESSTSDSDMSFSLDCSGLSDSQNPNQDDSSATPLSVVMTAGIETSPKIDRDNKRRLSEDAGPVGKRSSDKDIRTITIGELESDGKGEKEFRTANIDDKKIHKHFKVHVIGDSVLLQLTHPCQFYVFGQIQVNVLLGRIKVLGYDIDNKKGSHIISSLRGSSFLSIRALRTPDNQLRNIVIPSGLREESSIRALINQSNTNDTWILAKKDKYDSVEFIQKYLEFPISPKAINRYDQSVISEAQFKLNCIFEPDSNSGKKTVESKDWDKIVSAIKAEKKGCTVLCGGKGVGKSTLLRYLINQLLSSGKGGEQGIVVLDFDPGQAEFTTPGCVALSFIKKPLLGPNYSHLQYAERCIYIGEISVAQCAARYMEACASIINFFRECSHLQCIPCLVNTMGFTSGIGVTIMGQLIKLLRPNRVVQIQSKRNRNNYPFLLTGHEVIARSNQLDSLCIRENLLSSTAQVQAELCYELVTLKSCAEVEASKDENVWGMSPRVSRDAVILSYFSKLASPPNYSLLDDVPYSCPLSSLFLCVAHQQVPAEYILAAINGNMVGLCCIDPLKEDVLYSITSDMPSVLRKVPIAPCVGFGVVRGIDLNSKVLYLSTPLNETQLRQVNCLVFGVVNLPTSIFVNASTPGLVPYTSDGAHPDLTIQTEL